MTSPNIADWIRRQPLEPLFNTERIQGYLTAVCGAYCIYYIMHRVRGVPMSEIVKLLSSDPFVVDSYVAAWVSKHCNLNAEVFDEPHFVSQLCTLFGLP